jgi:hypothetical protein
MRPAQVGWRLASGRLKHDHRRVDDSWQGPRPVFLAQNAQTATATGIPVEKAKPVLQKTPLQQPTSEEIREQQTIAKTSAPASTLSF